MIFSRNALKFQDHVLYPAVLLQSYASTDGSEYSEILYIIPLREECGLGKIGKFAISDQTDRIPTAELKYKIGLYNDDGYDAWRPTLPSPNGENLA